VRFLLRLTPNAEAEIAALESDPGQAKRLKAVRKTLALLGTNLKHPGLHTHKFESLTGPGGEPVFEAYAENKTPAAFRVFWHYGPGKGILTVLSITSHP